LPPAWAGPFVGLAPLWLSCSHATRPFKVGLGTCGAFGPRLGRGPLMPSTGTQNRGREDLVDYRVFPSRRSKPAHLSIVIKSESRPGRACLATASQPGFHVLPALRNSSLLCCRQRIGSGPTGSGTSAEVPSHGPPEPVESKCIMIADDSALDVLGLAVSGILIRLKRHIQKPLAA
jgi:hypothetical protein